MATLKQELIAFVQTGNLQALQRAFAADPSILTQSYADSGNYLVHYAVALPHSSLKVVQWLFENTPAEIATKENAQGNTPFLVAIAEGSVQTVEWLCDQSYVDCNYLSSQNKHTPSSTAVAYNRFDMVKFFIESAIISVDFVDIRGMNFLMSAVMYKKQAILQWLVRVADANLLMKDNDGHNVLMYAARFDNLEAFKWLLENTRLPIDCEDKLGRTLLMNAVTTNSVRVTRYLLQTLKVDPNVTDNSQKTALACGFNVGSNSIETMPYLIADPRTLFDLVDNQHKLPIEYASRDDDTGRVNLMTFSRAIQQRALNSTKFKITKKEVRGFERELETGKRDFLIRHAQTLDFLKATFTEFIGFLIHSYQFAEVEAYPAYFVTNKEAQKIIDYQFAYTELIELNARHAALGTAVDLSRLPYNPLLLGLVPSASHFVALAVKKFQLQGLLPDAPAQAIPAESPEDEHSCDEDDASGFESLEENEGYKSDGPDMLRQLEDEHRKYLQAVADLMPYPPAIPDNVTSSTGANADSYEVLTSLGVITPSVSHKRRGSTSDFFRSPLNPQESKTGNPPKPVSQPTPILERGLNTFFASLVLSSPPKRPKNHCAASPGLNPTNG